MKSLPKAAILAAILALATEPAAAQLPGAKGSFVSLPPELDRILRDYEQAWRAHDAAALAALFADDGFILPSGSPPVRGRSSIQTAYSKAGGPLALHALAARTSGDTGYIIGVFGREPSGPLVGKFVLALIKASSGRWLIMADIDNSMRQASPSPSPTPVATLGQR